MVISLGMANTYSQMYIQIVFAVKYRRAMLDKRWRGEVFKVMSTLIKETGCNSIIVNGVEDHVHCFVGLKPAISVSELMKGVKAKSSKFINDKALTNDRFEWQKGFGVFSYSQSQVERVYRYILNQEAHHSKETFRAEYVRNLKEFEVVYDENYLFLDPI